MWVTVHTVKKLASHGSYGGCDSGRTRLCGLQGWDMFVNETQHEPNVVVFASALWDIARRASPAKACGAGTRSTDALKAKQVTAISAPSCAG